MLRDHGGERKLYLAVLEDALARVGGSNPEGVAPGPLATQVEETRAWFRSDDGDAAFSFVSVCEALGLDPGAIRTAALRRQTRTKGLT
jgi:hypothetical protein